jgi:hypothetical protein
MYRFHSVTQSAAFALAMSGLMAVGLAAPASAATGAPSAPAAAARVKPAAGEDAMAKSPATDALNLLESKGYGDFNNFHRDGRMYAATVTRDGKTMTLTIDPATGKIEKRDS